MSNEFWNVFADTGEPMAYLLCVAGEKEKPTPEIVPIPDEFRTDTPHRSVPVGPRCGG